jgi:two-component system cell cycle response regulator
MQSKVKHRRARTVRISRDDVAIQTGPRPTRAAIQIIVGEPQDLGMHEPLDTPLVVGRGDEANFTISDDSASRLHAWVGWDDKEKGYVARDMDSTNGTFVNGEPVKGQVILMHGDRLEVGETLFEFRLADDKEIENQEKIEAWLSTDELTGLPNKRRFDAELRRRVTNLGPQGVWIGILMLDLDNLKSINDHHGHHMGSRTICEVGQIIGEIVAGKGLGTRFGGDEYTVFLVGHSLEDTLAVGEEIRTHVEDLQIEKDDVIIRTTISIGVAAAPCSELDPEWLCREADKALYRAKDKGRNMVSE